MSDGDRGHLHTLRESDVATVIKFSIRIFGFGFNIPIWSIAAWIFNLLGKLFSFLSQALKCNGRRGMCVHRQAFCQISACVCVQPMGLIPTVEDEDFELNLIQK